MNSMSNYTETGVLNTLKGTSFTAPAKTFVGLFLSDPTSANTGGVELSYDGYMRAEITEWTTPAWDISAQQTTTSNVTDATFAIPPSDQGTVTHIAIFDSAVDGNKLFYGALEEAIPLKSGESPVIISGLINLSLKGDFTEAWQSKILGLLNGTSVGGVDTYLSLLNGDAEVIGDNYSRVAVQWGDVVQQSSGVATLKNVSQTAFPRANTNWGSFNKYSLYDAPSGGTAIWAKTVTTENIQKFKMILIPAGDLTVGVN